MTNRFTTFKKIDKNRFKKIYPINRRPPKDGYTSDKGLVIETQKVDFSNEFSKRIKLEGKYTDMPTVVVSSFSTSPESNGNVNLFISSLTFSGDFLYAQIEASAKFTGTAAIQVIEIY